MTVETQHSRTCGCSTVPREKITVINAYTKEKRKQLKFTPEGTRKRTN